MKLAINVIAAFFIGFVAGVSPFLFMYLLPGLLNPSQALIECNPWCIILTGVLIGAITCIVFAKKFAEKDPSDVFFYALGIPAILIGTLTNLNTNFSKIDIQKTASRLLLETKPSIEEIDKKLSDVPSPVPEAAKPKQSSLLIMVPAWADEETKDRMVKVAKAEQYVVVIGQYPTEGEAGRVYNELSRKRLNAEKYAPKNLRIFTIPGSNSYYLSYSNHASESEAVKVYKLLMLNDPELAPRIIKQK
jgi:hypothetical protein